jgi:thioester reductase-like protein
MLEHILAAEPRALVYAVVLPSLLAQAQAILDALAPEQKRRVEMLQGDAAAIDLGLSGAEFRQVTREIDRIHHLACASHLGVDRKAAEKLNIHGAAEILELARATTSLDCLVFHSTALVSGDRTGIVYEEDLDRRQSFRSVVDETRMRAEVLVRRAMHEVPIAVIRPATLVGDSTSGEIDRLDGIYLLALLVLATPAELSLPLPPAFGEAPLHIVPTDFVVRAAHAIGRHRSAPGRTFHLVDPHPLSARRVFDLITRAAGQRPSIGSVPSKFARALLRTPGIDRFARNPRAFIEQFASPVRYDARNTETALQGTGITCPPFEAYADQLVAVVQQYLRSSPQRDAAETEVEDPLS